MPTEFICPTCGKILSTNQRLETHIDSGKCKEAELQCKDCKEVFKKKKYLNNHIRNVCKGKIESRTDKDKQIADLERALSDLRENADNDDNDIMDMADKLSLAESRLKEYQQATSSQYHQYDNECIMPDIPPSETEPKWIYPENVDSPSTIGEIDPDSAQVYVLKPGPLLKPLVNIIGFPIKIGSSDTPYTRIINQHKRDFGGASVIDSIICENPSQVESKFKRWLNMQNRFVACKTDKKKSVETEVIVVQNPDDYAKIHSQIVKYAQELKISRGDEIETQKDIQALSNEIISLKQQLLSLFNQTRKRYPVRASKLIYQISAIQS